PYFTGIAMYNPNASDVTVTIDVFSADGVKTGSATLPLRSGNRISKVLPELVPEVTNQIRGYIRISASGPIISFELFGDQALELLSAVPPQPITPYAWGPPPQNNVCASAKRGSNQKELFPRFATKTRT